MNIGQKSRTSSEMLQTSWLVLSTQPRLVLLPLLALVIGINFPDSRSVGQAEWAQMLWLGARYLLIGLIILFIEVAFCHEALRALRGETTVNLERGIRYAASRWRALLLWNLLSVTAGIILETTGEHVGWFGGFGGVLFELGWAAMLLLSTPVLVRREAQNPFGVIPESVRLLRKVLGESITGIVGILIIFVAAIFVGILGLILMGLITRISGLDTAWVRAAFLLGAMGLLGLFLALGSIYCCAVYIYASEGVVPDPDVVAPMDTAWKITAKH